MRFVLVTFSACLHAIATATPQPDGATNTIMEVYPLLSPTLFFNGHIDHNETSTETDIRHVLGDDVLLRNQDPCCICYESYTAIDMVSELTCRHAFHTLCVQEWFRYNTACPLCRAPVRTVARARGRGSGTTYVF